MKSTRPVTRFRTNPQTAMPRSLGISCALKPVKTWLKCKVTMKDSPTATAMPTECSAINVGKPSIDSNTHSEKAESSR